MNLIIIMLSSLLIFAFVFALGKDLFHKKVSKAVFDAAMLDHLLEETSRYREFYARSLQINDLQLQKNIEEKILEKQSELLAYQDSLKSYSLQQAFCHVKTRLIEELKLINLLKKDNTRTSRFACEPDREPSCSLLGHYYQLADAMED